MIIASSNVNMSSQRQYTRTTRYTNSAVSWANYGGSMHLNAQESAYSHTYEERDSYMSNSGTSDLFGQFPSYNRFGLDVSDSDVSTGTLNGSSMDENTRANHTVLFTTLRSLLEILMKSRFKHLAMGSSTWNSMTGSTSLGNTLSLTSSDNRATWTQVAHTSYFMEEKETTSFETTGSAVTADGRTIPFQVSMEMSSSFTESSEYAFITQYEQILTDPLVINLDSSPATITDKKFFFDLDCDGVREELSELASGHGFLAYDKNNDGKINDGSELFGPATNRGFQELASFDSDGNQWIDEADEIYKDLKVWTKDENGRDKLLTLKEANVGAIYLGSSTTQFSLKDGANNLGGRVRSSGIYLKENGEVGTVQQVDF